MTIPRPVRSRAKQHVMERRAAAQVISAAQRWARYMELFTRDLRTADEVREREDLRGLTDDPS